MLLLAENCELTIFERDRHKAMRMDEWDIFHKRFADIEAKELTQRQKEYAESQAKIKVRYCPLCKKRFENPTIKIETHTSGNSKFTITGCQTCIKERKNQVDKIQTAKHKPGQVIKAPLNTQTSFVEQVRTGSHREVDNNPVFRHPIRRIVEDYKTVYHDSLVSKEWLEAHINDGKDFEPLIEITVDNGKNISVNGNYKKGMIELFLSEYTEVVRAGKSNMRINKGEVIVNYGGNLYLGMTPERVKEFIGG